MPHAEVGGLCIYYEDRPPLRPAAGVPVVLHLGIPRAAVVGFSLGEVNRALSEFLAGVP